MLLLQREPFEKKEEEKKIGLPFPKELNILAVFLLLLAVSGNFIGETMSCQSQKFLSENMFAKHFIIVSMLFFTMTLTNTEVVNPLVTFGWALIYWGLFLLATKTHLVATIVLFLVLGSIFVLQNYAAYLEKELEKEENSQFEKDIDNIEGYAIPILTYAFLGILVIAFIAYFVKQWRDHRANFNPLKFLFGVPKCGQSKLVAPAEGVSGIAQLFGAKKI
jgi:hypothetical protein